MQRRYPRAKASLGEQRITLMTDEAEVSCERLCLALATQLGSLTAGQRAGAAERSGYRALCRGGQAHPSAAHGWLVRHQQAHAGDSFWRNKAVGAQPVDCAPASPEHQIRPKSGALSWLGGLV